MRRPAAALRRRDELAAELRAQGAGGAARKLGDCGDYARPLVCGCQRSRVASPIFCKLRTCELCALLEAGRQRREIRRRLAFVEHNYQRVGYGLKLVTLTVRTEPAACSRFEPKGDDDGQVNRWVRRVLERAAQVLKRTAPGDAAEPWPGRRNRHREGAGGVAVLELGSRRNWHVHALVYSGWIDRAELRRRWWRASLCFVCRGCGRHRELGQHMRARVARLYVDDPDEQARRLERVPTPVCPCGQVMALHDSFIVDVRAVHSARRAVRYVTKYVAKPASSGSARDLALVERSLAGIRRVRAWGSLAAIPEAELEKVVPRKPRERDRCPKCGGVLELDLEVMVQAQVVLGGRMPRVSELQRPPPRSELARAWPVHTTLDDFRDFGPLRYVA